MADLKGELATLKIDRTRPRRSAWRWPLLLLVPALLVLAVFYGLRARQALSAPEVETVTAAVSRDVQPSAGDPHPHRLRLRRRPAPGRGLGQDPGAARPS